MDCRGAARYNIGIDVGGTNTDGVLYDCFEKRIAASVKVPTTHASYAHGIENSLRVLLASSPNGAGSIVSLNVSTTLSTNAILEGKTAPSNLILAGFKKYPHIVSEIEKTICPSAILKVKGGHTGWGMEREPLDIGAIIDFVKDRPGEPFTVSSYYSSRNPEHEIKAREILLSHGAGHVTCGHELSYSKLNSVKRTVTAYLNTSLVPITGKLLNDLSSVSKRMQLACPIMFLRSDSTLVPAEWCAKFPIEMIYSGPAASLRGISHLAEEGSRGICIVADIGGTSTDIGRIENGRGVFSKGGATIGSYRTMIPSLDILSIALGGDSRITLADDGDVRIGPERSLPICMTPREPGLSGGQLADGCLTPTDIFNVLGLASTGDPEASAAALSLFEKSTYGGAGAAVKISDKVHRMLEDSIIRYLPGGGRLRRMYAGAPAGAFAGLSDDSEAEVTVPVNGDVAGAVGAAVSSVEFSCRIFIMRDFDDNNFTAFLPCGVVSSENFSELFKTAKMEAEIYLLELAKSMGYSHATVTAEEAFVYAGRVKDETTLLSVSIESRALPRE